MQELKGKTQDMVSKYEDRLASKGIKISISKKYFETAVRERPRGYDNVLVSVAQAKDKFNEKRYNHQRNQYHCIVLSVIPVDKNLVRREQCKDYAVVISKTERTHTGQKPEQTKYEEDKVLSKIEKRILKIIKNAEKQPVQKVCKNTPFDTLRYFSFKHGYRNKSL